ncbi:MAG: EamA/RhaT family transporter, partial [Bacteroidota bacterium]
MIFLLLSILSSFGIFLIFRLASRNKAHLFSIIIINYFVAAILGFFLTSKNIPWSEMAPGWYFMSLLIGILFIIMFFIVGKSSEKA